ncbi:MAG: alpha/beta hydrolase [Prolixibacteraceae bacterium]
MKRLIRIIVIFLALATSVFLAGPKPPKPLLNNETTPITAGLHDLDNYLKEKENALPVKPGNASKIVWENDSMKRKTAHVLLYLHGFSASGYEGYPTHVNFARHFKANAFIPRLASHGLAVSEPLEEMTPDRLYESAKDALQLARLLGDKVVVMSTSTGGTLSLKLAAEFPDQIAGLLLLSPNIRINNPSAFLLSGPWGLQIARAAFGSNYRYINEDTQAEECRYWNCFYRLEATVYLQQLIDATMNKELFRRVKIPVFLAYYYQDEEHQDGTVRVDAMLDMFEQLATPGELKQKQAFNAGTHVIGCELFSKAQPEVEQACIRFAKEVLGMKASGKSNE